MQYSRFVFFLHHLVVERVLKRPHTLDGSELKLERFNPQQSPEVRKKVTLTTNKLALLNL